MRVFIRVYKNIATYRNASKINSNPEAASTEHARLHLGRHPCDIELLGCHGKDVSNRNDKSPHSGDFASSFMPRGFYKRNRG